MRYVTILILLVIIGCSTQVNNEHQEVNGSDSDSLQNKGVTIINGVERSELALLMRSMYEEMELVRDSLKSGYEVKTDYLKRYERIHNATPTEAKKIDDSYQAMATAFLSSYQMFEAAQSDQVEHFNMMIQNCMVCHEHKCPGPVKAIKKLRIKPTASSASL